MKTLQQWHMYIQKLTDMIDECIKSKEDEALTLHHLAQKLGYSESYISKKFYEISGMHLRHYLHHRRLAFALKALRDTERGILDIAADAGFSSQEAFTRAFKKAYGLTPGAYRKNTTPVVLRTLIHPLDCYLLGIGGTGMANTVPIPRFFNPREIVLLRLIPQQKN